MANALTTFFARTFGAPKRTEKAAPPALSPVDNRGGWWNLIRESFAGAWQQNIEVNADTVAAYWAVFSCVTLIAGDISKLSLRVMQRSANGIWKTVLDRRPLLQRPNRFQTRAEFIFYWVASKLLTGNTYVLKERDERGFVRALYVLDPRRVTVLVAEDGSVYYQLMSDDLSQIPDGLPTLPASEVIHDKMYTLFHPLVGLSPIYACGVPAMQGSAILGNSTKLFQNMARPSGILTAPGAISSETAARLKEAWETNYSAGNFGKVAVLGDNLKYEALSMTAEDAQLIEQLKMTAEMVAACFHVPGYKIGVGPMPTVNNTASLNQQYYDTCLQYLIETMELRLDIGLELPDGYETTFDLDGLVRMDPDTRFKAHSEAIRGGWKSPNEARRAEDLDPVAGGDTPYLQQQNYSLAALSRRDTDLVNAGEEGVDVQATAMNGAQVTALQGIVLAVSQGQMPKDTAKATIAAAFPLLTQAQIASIVDPIEEGVSGETPEPLNDEGARSFVDEIVKGLML